MNTTGILGLFCGITVAFGLFLSTYFLFIRKESKHYSALLGALFLAISLRISKSIWFFIFYEVAPIGLMIGYLSLSIIGPVVFLYIRDTTKNTVLQRSDLWHLAIPVIGALISLLSNLENVTIAYKSTTLLMLCYISSAWWLHTKHLYKVARLKFWNRQLLIAVSIVWSSFTYQHISETLMDYAIGAGIASIPIYYLLVVILKNPNVFVKPQAIELPNDTIMKVKEAFEKDKIYLTHNLTLTQFAGSVEIPTYLITKTVNHLYNRTFPETVNYFRVKEVKHQLVNNAEEFVKIEGLAHDAGFKTVSTFYTAFKKETGMSPTAFQRQNTLQATS